MAEILSKFIYRDKDWLRKKYWDEDLTMREVAKLADTSHQRVRYWMQKHNIPVKYTFPWNRGLTAKTCHRVKAHKNHWSWKGGKRKFGGYYYIYKPDHPYAQSGNKAGVYVRDHRLVMEKHIGRYLHPWEVVHHKNGIKIDSRIENLELLQSNAKHNKLMHVIVKENEQLKQTVVFLLSVIANRRDSNF